MPRSTENKLQEAYQLREKLETDRPRPSLSEGFQPYIVRLRGVTFAFVCVDKGSSRAGIFELLVINRIPFIDVGMGLNRTRGPINGMLRATYYSVEDAQRLMDMDLAELADHPDDEYRVHIQISELNALNAALAVTKYKQLRGFYFEEESLNSLVFEVGDLKTANENL